MRARPIRGRPLYPFHSSVLTVVPSSVVHSMTSSSSAPSLWSSTSERSTPDSRPTTPAIGGRSLANVPWPRRRLARRRGGSPGSSCGTPFFPRILVHLVGLDHGVTQRVPVQADPGMLLEAVPQLQEVLAVAAQLAGHLGRGLARGHTVEDQQELRRAAVRPLQVGTGPGVEDPAAVTTLVIQDRLPVAVVDPQVLPLTARGTGQPVGVEYLDEFAVARVLVHGVDQGEIHGYGLRPTRCICLNAKPLGCGRQEAGHGSRPMSRTGPGDSTPRSVGTSFD